MEKKAGRPKAKKRKTPQPQIAEFELSRLKPAKYNPRTISDEALAGLAVSIDKFGCVEPIIINTRAGRNRIVGGHQRYKVLKELKGKGHKCMCVTVDLTEAQEKLLNITLNNPQIQGRFIEQLGEYIDKLRGELPDEDMLALRIAELQGDVEQQACEYTEEKIQPYKRTHILLSFEPALLLKIQEHLLAIMQVEGIEYEQCSN